MLTTAPSVTGRLARASANHPWRVVAAWGLVLAASVLAIGSLIGSAFTSDATLTTNPESARAHQVMAENFSRGDRIDDAVIVYSARLGVDDPEFRGFVEEVRGAIEDDRGGREDRRPVRRRHAGSPRTVTRRWSP